MLQSTGNYFVLVSTGAGRPTTLLDLASLPRRRFIEGRISSFPVSWKGKKKARRVCHMVLFRHTEVQSKPFNTDFEGAINKKCLY